jgi:membrane protein
MAEAIVSKPTPYQRATARVKAFILRLEQNPRTARPMLTIRALIYGLRTEPISLRASALTYLTVLAIIPLLVVVFSLFQAVVGTKELESRLQDYVFKNLAVGVQGDVSRYISQYIQRASSFGFVGFALVLFSSISLMANVETALNHIFRAPKPRPLALRFGIYWCLLTLGPILLAVSLSATALFQSSAMKWLGPLQSLLTFFLPLVVTVAAFLLIYVIVPAIYVNRRSAVVGAVIAGLAWEVAKIGYAEVSRHSVRNGAIYGSLSAVPIFLLWTYVSWIIVLFGARITYALQSGYLAIGSEGLGTPLGRELFVARLMRHIAEAFAMGGRAPSTRALSLAMHLPETETAPALQRLREAGLIHHLENGGWMPARPLNQITLAEVRAAARQSEEVSSLAPDLAELRSRWAAADQAADDELAVTLEDLVQRNRDSGQAAPVA